MIAFTIRRLLVSIPILVLSTFLVFILVAWGADPLGSLRARNPPVPASTFKAEEHRLGLDQNLIMQYWHWISRLVLHGDFGPSVQQGYDIKSQLGIRIGVTARLVISAIVLALVLAIIVGVITAVRQYSKFDYAATLFGFFFLSLPVFWFAILLKVWAVDFNNATGNSFIKTLGPPGGQFGSPLNAIGYLILPTITLSLTSYASWARFQRASMLDVLNSDYIRLARSKGLSRRKVMVRHGLRTALIPLTTQVTLDVAVIMGGTVITEKIFQWQGLGTMFIDGINTQDTNVVLAWLLIAATLVIVFNLIADLLYAVLDPRIRLA
jgi:peptide/nickel transport system permease protein